MGYRPITPQALDALLTREVYPGLERLGVVGLAAVVVQAPSPQQATQVDSVLFGGYGGGASSEPGRLGQALRIPVKYCKGFGFESSELGVVTDVDSTLFDSGSCAELLVVLSALQMEEQGGLNLQQDVNRYLPKELAQDNVWTEKSSKITGAALLAHCSGLCQRKRGGTAAGTPGESPRPSPRGEDPAAEGPPEGPAEAPGPGAAAGPREGEPGADAGAAAAGANGAAAAGAAGVEAPGGGEVEGGESYLSDNMLRVLNDPDPPRAGPPHARFERCPYNTKLASAMIEYQSGLDYHQYVARHILGPLKLGAIGTYAGDASKVVYRRDEGGKMRGERVEVENLAPLGGFVTTPKQMAELLFGVLDTLNVEDSYEKLFSEKVLGKLAETHYAFGSKKYSLGFEQVRLWPNGPTLLLCASAGPDLPPSLVCIEPEERWALWLGSNTVVEEEGDFAASFYGQVLESFVREFAPIGPEAAAAATTWYQPVQPVRRDPTVTLIGFPYSGGSAPLIFESWHRLLPNFIEVQTVLLPGRGVRIKEQAYSNLLELAAEVAKSLLPVLKSRPYALFGHGMGAVIAYEVARYAETQYGERPMCLFVSGSPSPLICGSDEGGHFPWTHELSEAATELDETLKLHGMGGSRPSSREWDGAAEGGDPAVHIRSKLHTLSDSNLHDTLSTSSRLPRPFKQNSLMLRAMITSMRADISLEETYIHKDRFGDFPSRWEGNVVEASAGGGGEPATGDFEKLRCPVVAYYGVSDDYIDKGSMQSWQDITSGPLSIHRIPGDHYYLEDPKARDVLAGSIATFFTGMLTKYESWIIAGNYNGVR